MPYQKSRLPVSDRKTIADLVAASRNQESETSGHSQPADLPAVPLDSKAVFAAAEIQDRFCPGAAVCQKLFRAAPAAPVIRRNDQILCQPILSGKYPDLLSALALVDGGLQVQRRVRRAHAETGSRRGGVQDRRLVPVFRLVAVFHGNGVQVDLHLTSTCCQKSQIHCIPLSAEKDLLIHRDLKSHRGDAPLRGDCDSDMGLVLFQQDLQPSPGMGRNARSALRAGDGADLLNVSRQDPLSSEYAEGPAEDPAGDHIGIRIAGYGIRLQGVPEKESQSLLSVLFFGQRKAPDTNGSSKHHVVTCGNRSRKAHHLVISGIRYFSLSRWHAHARRAVFGINAYQFLLHTGCAPRREHPVRKRVAARL